MTAPGGSTRDITVDVTIRSDTKGAKQGAAALGDVDKAAGAAGKSMKGMEGDSKSLTAQISKSKETVRGLEEELSRVGNNPGLRKSLRVERSWLAELEKIQKGLRFTSEGGGAIAKGLDSALSAIGPGKGALYGTLIAGAVAAAPVIGGIIGGAVAGGVGTLGVVAGVVAASRDAGVKAAFADLADTAKAEFFGVGDVFVGPVLSSIGVLKRAVVDIDLESTLAKAAPYVEVIATGLANLVRNVMPGLDRTMGRLGPFADVAAEGFAALGTSLGGFLDDVTASEGAVEGLETAFRLVAGTITVVGKTIYGLSEAFDWLLRTEEAIFSWAADLNIPGFDGFLEKTHDTIKNLRDVPDSAGPATTSFDRFGEAVEGTSKKLDPFAGYLYEAEHRADGLNGALSDLFGIQMSIDQATLRWQEDILHLIEATKEHGTTLDTNTQAGLDNRQMILGLIEDAKAVRKATYEQTGSVDVANAAYARQIEVLKETLKHLGYTEQKIKDMVGDYEINVNVNTRFKESGTTSVQFKNLILEDRLEGRASGGPVVAGVPYKINERGYETVTFPAGGQVHPASLTPMMGGGSTTVVVSPGGPMTDALGRALMDWLRVEIQGLGGPLRAFG